MMLKMNHCSRISSNTEITIQTSNNRAKATTWAIYRGFLHYVQEEKGRINNPSDLIEELFCEAFERS